MKKERVSFFFFFSKKKKRLLFLLCSRQKKMNSLGKMNLNLSCGLPTLLKNKGVEDDGNG